MFGQKQDKCFPKRWSGFLHPPLVVEHVALGKSTLPSLFSLFSPSVVEMSSFVLKIHLGRGKMNREKVQVESRITIL